MINYIKSGETLTVIAPANVSSGALVVVGAIVGVASFDAALNAEVEVTTEGVFTLPKATADVIAAGAKLYWDTVASKLTVTAGTGSKVLVGYAIRAAGNGVPTVDALLVPTLQTGPA